MHDLENTAPISFFSFFFATPFLPAGIRRPLKKEKKRKKRTSGRRGTNERTNGGERVVFSPPPPPPHLFRDGDTFLRIFQRDAGPSVPFSFVDRFSAYVGDPFMVVDYFSAGFKASDLGERCVDK